MNLLKILILLISLISSTFKAQLLSFNPEYIFEQFPIFNSDYVQKNKIKSITFDIIDKKDWQEAEDKNLVEVYEFDTQGRLIRKYHTSIKKIIQQQIENKKHKVIATKEFYEYDTTSTEYIYQPSLIIQRHKMPNNYIEATYFKLCNQQICKEEKYIETYRYLSTGQQVLDKLLLKASDSIANFNYEKQIKQIYYNNEKLPYKEKLIYLNNKNQITEILEQLTVASGKIKKKFEYNDNNKLKSAEMIINYGTPQNYYISYTYDNQQNVLSENHTKNNTLFREYQYIYDENNNLKSILIRTYEDKNIRIIKLKYEYY